MRFHDIFYSIMSTIASYAGRRSMRGKCPNTEFFWSVFSCIRTEYGDLRSKSKSPYLVRIQENTYQKKLRIWTLFTLVEIYSFTDVLRCSLSKAFSKFTSCFCKVRSFVGPLWETINQGFSAEREEILVAFLFIFIYEFFYLCM